MPPRRIKRGAEVELNIESFADRGKSLARVDGYVVFVAGAVPGDRVRARVYKRKKSFAEARLLEILTPSDLRVVPRCAYARTCGGCKWQHVDYAAQLKMKRESVTDALVRTGGLSLGTVPVQPVLGMDEPFYYRNKMEFSFSANRWLTDWEIASGKTFDKGFALGLHVPGRYDKVLDLTECHLQSTWSASLVNVVRDFATERGWAPWNVHTHEGYLRHLVVREASRTDERMVNLVTSRKDADRETEFAEWLREEVPAVTTFVVTVNKTKAHTSYGEMRTVFGAGVIHERLGGLTFEIAPNAFFQTNTKQAERLYEVAAECAQLRPDDLVYDLYCGAGTISLFIAGRVRRVVGVELVEEAVENARANAVHNGVENCTFVAGDMMELFTPSFVDEYGTPDVLLVDPPRAGLHPKVVAHIAALRAPRVVYVSCNPQTQARDLAGLADTYRIEHIQPVDLFPHTHHIENVVSLRAL